MDGQLTLKASMFQGGSLRSKEDFLSDGRSYVSQYWTWEGISNVTSIRKIGGAWRE